MIITTSYEPNKEMIQRAEILTNQLNGILIKRKRLSLSMIRSLYNDEPIIVVEKKHSKLYTESLEVPFYFHPNMAILRIKQLQKGDNDLLVNIAELQPGDSFLDCSLGLGSDSIVASFVVGQEGKIVGLESQEVIAVLVKEGLQMGWKEDPEIADAMKRIEVVNTNHLDYLKSLPSKSFDIVYFDPMFRRTVKESVSIGPLRGLANHNPLTIEAIIEAKRVARRKVILKENSRSGEFERLGFRIVPRSSSITYGILKEVE